MVNHFTNDRLKLLLPFLKETVLLKINQGFTLKKFFFELDTNCLNLSSSQDWVISADYPSRDTKCFFSGGIKRVGFLDFWQLLF